MKKVLILFFSLVYAFGCISVTAYADFDKPEDEIIISEYNNVNEMRARLDITNGNANVIIFYQGYDGITEGATITTKIQKRFLLVFWTDVDIGMPNNEWVDQSTATSYSNSHSVALSSTGTYRAIVSFTVYGSGGSPDTATIEKQAVYN